MRISDWSSDVCSSDLSHNDNKITYFARTNSRVPKVFGIKQRDRVYHTHLIGRTGSGKTTLLETLICQDIDAGRGLAVIDPHGDQIGRASCRERVWQYV